MCVINMSIFDVEMCSSLNGGSACLQHDLRNFLYFRLGQLPEDNDLILQFDLVHFVSRDINELQ